ISGHVSVIYLKTTSIKSAPCFRTPALKPKIRPHSRLLWILIAGVLLMIPAAFVAGQSVTATKAAVYPLNNDNSARPGDTINYTITISNGAAAVNNASNVQMADTIDANSTFVNNSAKVSPNAIAHSYNAVGNTQISINAANGVLNGVTDIDGVTPAASLVVTTGTFATGQGGSVTINTASSNTTLVTTTASTNAITLNSGNAVRGFTIGNTTSYKIANTTTS